MSRAFVKEDTLTAPVVPRRAPLPDGARNYVTLRGLGQLRSELEELLRELRQAPSQAEAAALRARIAELEARIASAEPIDPTNGQSDVVRFGVRVTIRTADGAERAYRIVGVDEANAAEGRVAFVAPLARALLGKHIGETTLFKTPRGDEEIEISAIDAEDEPSIID